MIALLDNLSIRKLWLTAYERTAPCRTFGSSGRDADIAFLEGLHAKYGITTMGPPLRRRTRADRPPFRRACEPKRG
jgi:hypothetical protein